MALLEVRNVDAHYGRIQALRDVSSAIGLGHAQRDLAIARELRARRPELEIVWLAQHPVTAALEAAGEIVHPASKLMANESAHIEAETHEHDLHVPGECGGPEARQPHRVDRRIART